MFSHTYVHPCVINNQPTIVYTRGLQSLSPRLFKQLHQYYAALGYALKEDQRSASTTSNNPQRRQWAPVLLFTAALLFENTANADVTVQLTDTPSNSQKVTLQLISNNPLRHQIQQQIEASPLTVTSNLSDSVQSETDILYLLQQHYQPQANDPAHITDDFKKMANYYSTFPEVVTLFAKLANKNWKMIFDEDNWTTVASGNMFNVENAVIHFNTRTAAQLRLNNSCEQNPVCIASPADALLHELLHTYSMLVNTEQFLQQGGMNRVLYPYQHEQHIIKQERELYQIMTRQDSILRPYRHNHAGRIIKAQCATCIR
jgi:hypothetical protein